MGFGFFSAPWSGCWLFDAFPIPIPNFNCSIPLFKIHKHIHQLNPCTSLSLIVVSKSKLSSVLSYRLVLLFLFDRYIFSKWLNFLKIASIPWAGHLPRFGNSPPQFPHLSFRFICWSGHLSCCKYSKISRLISKFRYLCSCWRKQFQSHIFF